MRRKLLVLPVLVAGMVGLTHGQPPGGGPDRGGMRMRFGGGPPDPEQMWGWMAKGQPSINLNDPANAMIKSRMERDGTPLPPGGILTKEQFTANFKARMDKTAAGGGQPGTPSVQFQTPGQPAPVAPGQFGGPGGGGRGPGGFDPSAMTDDQLRGMMGRYDTDRDGRISAAEAAASRSDALRDSFAQYDTSRDGFIDAAEYRVFFSARMQQRQAERTQPTPFTPGPAQPVQPFPPPAAPGQPNPAPGQPTGDDPARPDVLRYGKLPKGAPSWMLAPGPSNKDGLDADRDGQVGLYEWRRAGRKIADFVEQDLNGDGYLTHTEWKTYNERLAERQKAEDPDAPAPTVITPGGGTDRGGPKGERGPKGDRPSKEERKGARRNPFANASKPG